jgi:DNA invertase Pin-like site-specific DNA recombinase
MLKDACLRKFDVVMAWAIDRLGRSLVGLLGTIQGLEAKGIGINKVAKAVGLGVGTVAKLKGEMVANPSGSDGARRNPATIPLPPDLPVSEIGKHMK